MTRSMVLLGAALVLAATAPALAQTKQTPASPVSAAPGTDKAPFGCDARAPNACHFHVFYPRASRVIVLAAGMQVAVPEVKIGRDSYCMALNKRPAHKCERKIISATYNN